jgi:hypothetical protein
MHGVKGLMYGTARLIATIVIDTLVLFRPPKSMKAVNTILTAYGVENLWMVSRCLRAGILNGAVKLLKPEDDPDEKYGLDQVCDMD